jgi:hypothetical protein
MVRILSAQNPKMGSRFKEMKTETFSGQNPQRMAIYSKSSPVLLLHRKRPAKFFPLPLLVDATALDDLLARPGRTVISASFPAQRR